MMVMMNTPQSGIFALGTSAHAYVEFDLRSRGDGHALAVALANLREPRTTIGGVNLVSGFRPELWRALLPDDLPADLTGFNDDLVGADSYVMPATQHDAILWLSGNAYDVIFDSARAAIASLAPIASVGAETSSWPYQHDRDLTGFVDGTENPSLLEAPEVALIPPGSPGSGGSVLLVQKWVHDAPAWEALPVARQEATMGRTKQDSTELVDRPTDSHVARTDQEHFGKVFRRNMPYGTILDHGTMFVGFSAEQGRLTTMLESMAGVADGVRDALTRYTRPVTGAYYFVPSTQSIRALATAEETV